MTREFLTIINPQWFLPSADLYLAPLLQLSIAVDWD